ncbi:uncharacterized protein LOC131228156 isoform X2 [Magnolia sinica]|uniref:uncharacterized protein LOC131228156 isoform X2 n=1 Tax=Magnolia sinica TaxID=86752 RepID=UPI00265AE32F|nr:uncharacterized protein LOC131228156 isoform X2 [Magnolia sinica]
MASSVPGFSLPQPSLLFPSDYSTRRSLTRISTSSNQFRLESSLPESSDSASAVNDADDNPVKLAFAKAKAYEKNPNQSDANPSQKPIKIGDGDGDVPVSVKLAMEKAREYKKNKRVMGGGGNITEKQQFSGLGQMKVDNLREVVVEKMVEKKEEAKISSIDFLGFNFSDKKKTRGMPAGLVTPADPFPDGNLPEVELIIGDASRFENASALNPNPIEEDDGSELYKPNVSTWGVFPRPSNISKTFGGGRVIRPGEVLETAEDKAAKEARTKQLLAAYKNKMGLNIDAKTKRECEKALNDGDSLMDVGKLEEALPYYEKVMEDLVFQSELHGLAALQWSICQDSLSRPNEARAMYEKLQSHPNVQVSKKARQFVFGFQAMEMMKITSSFPPKTTGYQSYFEAFVKDKANYSPTKEENEDALRQTLPYIMLLVSPILIVLFIASRKLI